MDYIYVGKIVNTHALKGELRILSSFDYKEKVMKKGFSIYIGKTYEKKEIENYRKHKQYDMVTLKDIDTIEKASFYKGMNIYIKRGSIQIDGYFIEDLINLSVYDKEKYIGKIVEVEENTIHKILLLNNNIRIPYVKEYVKKIDIEKKQMEVELIKGFEL